LIRLNSGLGYEVKTAEEIANKFNKKGLTLIFLKVISELFNKS